MSCQQPPGSGPRMFSAGCTMNIGWKKLPREIAWLFFGVQLDSFREFEKQTVTRHGEGEARCRKNVDVERAQSRDHHCDGQDFAPLAPASISKASEAT